MGNLKTPPAKGPLELEIDAPFWAKIEGLEARLSAASALVLADQPPSVQALAARGRVTLWLTTDGQVRQLNRMFRGIDTPTNVLSFPQFTPSALKKAPPKGKEPVALGDIAMAWQTVRTQAKDEGKTPLDHATHLLIHGILHLFGYDHLTEAMASRMEKKEIKLMAALGLPDPYAPLKAAKKPAPVKRAASKKPPKLGKTKRGKA